MRNYILPIPELKKLEPVLSEYFGYKRAMFESELLATYYKYYPKGVSKEVANKYMIEFPFMDEFGADNGAFDYHRYLPRQASTSKTFDPTSFIMDSKYDITITLSDDKLQRELEKKLQECGETDEESTIVTSLLIVAAIYEKYVRGELYTEITMSEDTLPYLEQVRPEMLKLFELLNTKRYSPSKKKELRVFNPITIDNGVKKITLDNSCHWLTDLLDNYLHIYLGVNNLEEAQTELKEVYAEKKGRKANNAACNLIMYGTFHLLQRYSSLKTKSEQIRMTLGYMELLFETDSFNNDENSTNAAIAYLVKQGYKPMWKPKQIEDYRFSPNNQSTEHLW
ncbi:hypothetical protein [Bacteroides faecalis]|uniref:Uncharacterized protein n=1 Tax=Bacteroides faecalis TaxID=2447885 RepID=A0A401LPL7_9BACE|nr:hypothetical protein [Bacteroides faecalis]GCB33433.1 hypothetical protein KGMB02408_03780 [Bacteroides faecalis]